MSFEVRKGLVIEDDPQIVLLLYRIFPPPKWTLDVAVKFKEAVKKIEATNNGYDFIFADLNLDDSRGKETLTQLHHASGAPIVASSGDDLSWLEERQEEFGVYGFIGKSSWTANRVRDVIEGAIAKWTVKRYETVTAILREERTKWRREFLGHGA